MDFTFQEMQKYRRSEISINIVDETTSMSSIQEHSVVH